MKYEELYNDFLEEITQSIPQKTEVVNVLSGMLNIGRDAVYRRLRGEVPFSFYEVMTISKELKISLDELNMGGKATSRPFNLKLIEYINPAESDFALMEEVNNVLKFVHTDPKANGGEVTSILPQPLYVKHESLLRFYLFKWKYQTNSEAHVIPYRDIVIVDQLKRLQEENREWAWSIQTEYILDNQIFHYLVNYVRYFHDIGLISHDEVREIKDDLLKILHEIDSLSRTGIVKETGKKLDIYISNLNIETSYCYIDSTDDQLTIIKAFLLNGIASTDRKTLEELKRWIQSIKRQSFLITGCGERERINFLDEQESIIESLALA